MNLSFPRLLSAGPGVERIGLYLRLDFAHNRLRGKSAEPYNRTSTARRSKLPFAQCAPPFFGARGTRAAHGRPNRDFHAGRAAGCLSGTAAVVLGVVQLWRQRDKIGKSAADSAKLTVKFTRATCHSVEPPVRPRKNPQAVEFEDSGAKQLLRNLQFL